MSTQHPGSWKVRHTVKRQQRICIKTVRPRFASLRADSIICNRCVNVFLKRAHILHHIRRRIFWVSRRKYFPIRKRYARLLLRIVTFIQFQQIATRIHSIRIFYVADSCQIFLCRYSQCSAVLSAGDERTRYIHRLYHRICAFSSLIRNRLLRYRIGHSSSILRAGNRLPVFHMQQSVSNSPRSYFKAERTSYY